MLTSLQFLQPLWFLLLLPILGILTLLWRTRIAEISTSGQGVIAAHLARVFSLQGNKKASLKPIFLTLMVTILIIFSLAGPQFNLTGEQQVNSPLIIALDLSDSMTDEQQSTVTNLQRSKLIIDELLKKGFNRPVALLAFAGSAHQVLPVSDQLKLLRLYLGYLEPSVMPLQGSDLNQLLININSIKEAQQFGYDLLIVSDGFTVDAPAFKLAKKDNTILLAALNDQTTQQAQVLDVQLLTGKYLDSGDNRLYQLISDLSESNQSGKLTLTNIGYWFLYPVFLIVLYFFRRGFNLHWAVAIVLTVNLTPNTAEAAFIDWWMTPDQQGAYYFSKQDYKQAASHFEDKNWQAAAHFYAKDYQKASDIYEQQDDLTALYNLAVTNSKGRNYHRAQKLYQLLLEIQPDNNDARNNLRIITSLIKEIQLTAENQQEEDPPSDNSDTQDMMDEQLGAERDQIGKRKVQVETLSVDELLGSEQKKEQWLRDISRDPKLFLGAKFQAQYNQQLDQVGQLDE